MKHVRMETLDLGGGSDDAERIQQIYASQAECADDVMETKAVAPMEVTNVNSLIDEEEAAARSSAGAPSLDDEVIHL